MARGCKSPCFFYRGLWKIESLAILADETTRTAQAHLTTRELRHVVSAVDYRQ
jgi:hypothetical protein